MCEFIFSWLSVRLISEVDHSRTNQMKSKIRNIWRLFLTISSDDEFAETSFIRNKSETEVFLLFFNNSSHNNKGHLLVDGVRLLHFVD